MGPALNAGFIWDDDDYVTENPLLHAPDGFERIWLSTDAPSQYFPLVYTAFRIEYGLWGLDPFGYHLINVLLHAANALLLWLLLRRLEIAGAWFAAAVFALHPVHVESVAWITERKNVMSLFFSLLSLLAWMRFVEPRGKPAWRFFGLSLIWYALALSSKVTACTLPAAQVLLLWLRGHSIDRRRIAQVVPFVVLGVAMGLVITYWERYHIGTVGERFTIAPIESFLVATRATWFYLGKLLWPTQLAFSYPKFAIDPSDPLQYIWALAGAILLVALWSWRHAIGKAPLVAAIFFVATLSPLLGFIPLFTFWYTYVADHYQYMASIGPIALLSAGATQLLRNHTSLGKVSLGSAAALVLAVLGFLVWNQSRVYESEETLWRDTIAKNPTSWMAQTNLGRYMLREERFEEAVEAYGRVFAIKPDAYRAHVGRAGALREIGSRTGRGSRLQGGTRAEARFVHRPPGARALELETRSARDCDRPLRGDDRDRAAKPGRPFSDGSRSRKPQAAPRSARPLPECARSRSGTRGRAAGCRANRRFFGEPCRGALGNGPASPA